MKKQRSVIFFIVPCLNEERCVGWLVTKLGEEMERLQKAGKLSPKSRIVLVDDGSEDGTWAEIVGASERDKRVTGAKLSRNFGQQNAILAGMEIAEQAGAEAVISLDADLQDDIKAIEKMLDEFAAGAEIVLGVRGSRKTDTRFKRGTAAGFYWLMNRLGTKMVPEAAEFRLLSRRALEELKKYTETRLFLRGIIPEIGLKTKTVEYERGKRTVGESKYSIKKMVNLAVEAVTSFSMRPIRGLSLIGLVMIGLGIWRGESWIIGGIEVLAIWMVGEYAGRAYLETKRRPRYIIEEVIMKKTREKTAPKKQATVKPARKASNRRRNKVAGS